MMTCLKCGKEYRAGNAGVNLAKYPLQEMCNECLKANANNEETV